MKKAIITLLGLGIVSANVYAAETASSTGAAGGGNLQSPASKNITEGEAFLAANKQKPGVVTLPSGLQYKIMTGEAGKSPKAEDTVTVDYEGTLINGQEFDSSYKRGQPATFPVMGVIPGWTEILQLMPVGATWMVYIPASLAYGEQGAPPSIGPNETLIFKIHLISIN